MKSWSRRKFLAASGAGAALLAGCGRPAGEARTRLRRWLGKPTAPDLAGPLTAPATAAIDEFSHVLNRLTFGPRPGDYGRVATMGAGAFIEEQLAPEKIGDWICERIVRHHFPALEEPESRFFPRKADAADPLHALFPTLKDRGARVGDLYEYKEKLLFSDLSRATLLRAVYSERQLFEVMVQFWTDHFNIDPSKGECRWLKAADDRDVIRAHAMGNFRDLLRASAVSPAMLWYLDGRENRRRSPQEKPNENYARELMELHTLGVHGGYTQQDVIEVARCLTGWTVREKKRFFKGRVEFRPEEHDDGSKRVLGADIPAGLGALDLDRVLDILVAHPNCARFIAWKLCRRFIADEPPEGAVAAVASAFSKSSGDVRAMLRALFSTPEFMAEDMRGGKFKRPLHLVVSALRASRAETDAGPKLLEYLQRLGHAPFRYPTPDGYPEEATHWQSTLLWRWNFAAALAENQIAGARIEADAWRETVGGADVLLALLFGRTPTAAEREAFESSGGNLAVALSAPAFQRC
jgi:uncharacterized protein (DUF1800 family)